MKTGQVSFEYVAISSLLFFIVLIIAYFVSMSLGNVKGEVLVTEMERFADEIEAEIYLASTLKGDYDRSIKLPQRIRGYDYTLNLTNYPEFNYSTFEIVMYGVDGDIMYVGAKEMRMQRVLPLIKGKFAEGFMAATDTRYCITRNRAKDIIIGQEHISLETDNKTASVGDEIEVYAYLNCVKNVIGIKLSLAYNENNEHEVHLEDDSIIFSRDKDDLSERFFEKTNTPIINGIISGNCKGNIHSTPPDSNSKKCRVEIFKDPPNIGVDGSGYIATFKFKILPAAADKKIQIGVVGLETHTILPPVVRGKLKESFNVTINVV